jgi:hypothetical protein
MNLHSLSRLRHKAVKKLSIFSNVGGVCCPGDSADHARTGWNRKVADRNPPRPRNMKLRWITCALRRVYGQGHPWPQ